MTKKTPPNYTAYTIEKKADGELYRAVRIPPTGPSAPLPAPYGQWVERKWACKEASNALYRELCLGIMTGSQSTNGLSPEFTISQGGKKLT